MVRIDFLFGLYHREIYHRKTSIGLGFFLSDTCAHHLIQICIANAHIV